MPDQPGPSLPEETNQLTIDDLTAGAGVTVRTVRYYIGEGLLPPPSGAGPATRYTREHLDRLRLIGALKARYLPLREIRRRLRDMDAGEIHAAAADLPPVADASAEGDVASGAAGPGEEPSSAASYIEAVLRDEPAAVRRMQRPRGRRSLHEAGIRFPGAPYPGTPSGVPDMFPPPGGGERRWRRIAISPDAELTVDDDLYERRREQIEALVAHIRRVLA